LSRSTEAASQVVNRIKAFANIDNRRQFERDAIFVVVLGLILYLVVALLSFRPFEHWMYSSLGSGFRKSGNLGGPTGNMLAGGLYFYVGLTAATLPILLFQLAWNLRSANLKLSIIPVITGWLTLLLSLMPLLNSLQPTLPIRGVGFASGGAIGQILHTGLKANAGDVGSQIILWSALAASLLLISGTELSEFFSIVRRKLSVSTTGHVSATKPAFDSPSAPAAITQQTQDDSTPGLLVNQVAVNQTALKLADENKTLADLTLHEPGLFDSQLEAPRPNHEPDEESLAPLFTTGHDFAPKRPYAAPPLETFKRASDTLSTALTPKELEATGAVLTTTLAEFGVTGKIIGWQPGPVVTVYEFQPEAGIKQSKIVSLMDDLALSLKVDSIFINPVPGKRALGIQVPNQRREMVYLGDIIASEAFQRSPSPLTFAMGKNINGHPFTADLTTMPHLLAAGATGTGKSVGINSLLCSIIMKSSPDDVRMILVDPKMLELSVYDGIPHLLMPVITEPDRASSALKWAANEMERRYKIMQHAQVRNIGGFNTYWDSAVESKKEKIRGLMNDPQIGRLPYILLVIDELADLMLTAPKDVEGSIQRLAQKARASGIHMVLATQRPSVDVITGVIKANLPCRLSFQVVSRHDSKTILDNNGAEKLLGKGDLLLQRPGVGRLERLQGAFVSDEEVLALVAEAKQNYEVVYDDRAMGWIDEEVSRGAGLEDDGDTTGFAGASDAKWDDAVNIARTHGVVSASFLQRHLQIGYNRAARIVEAMEAKTLVAKADGSKPRKWLGG
jgi:S-DNA-T family DNA segregation ATPase FtsK/SpoIIIE